MHFTPASIVEAGHRAGFKVLKQSTESPPRSVSASLGQVLAIQIEGAQMVDAAAQPSAGGVKLVRPQSGCKNRG
jgi:hypothetical protein